MFGIGVPELILILALALIVLGPDKLPQVAKQIARFIGELKKASEDFKKQMDVEGLDDIRELKEMADLKNPQTWKKNFERLVDLDSDAELAHPLAGDKTDGKKSDLPGGLGDEWSIAGGHGGDKQTGGKDADKSGESRRESDARDGHSSFSYRDVTNPDIDYSRLESSSGDKGSEQEDLTGSDNQDSGSTRKS